MRVAKHADESRKRGERPDRRLHARYLLLILVAGLIPAAHSAALTAQSPERQPASPAPAPAAPTDTSRTARNSTRPAAEDARLDDLGRRVTLLSRQYQDLRDSLAKTAKPANPDNNATVQSADGSLKARVAGYLQADSRMYVDQNATPKASSLLLRRARPIIEATFNNRFVFRMMTDFAEGKVVLFDGYGEARFWPWLALRMGKFKPPIGLERLQSATDLRFTERGVPTNLVPNRDVGLQLSGDLYGGTLSYQAGVFDGVPDLGLGDTDAGNSKDLIGRLFLMPFLRRGPEILKNSGIGIAASSGNEQGTVAAPALGAYRTPGQVSAFQYRSDGTAANTVIASGRRVRIEPQGYLNAGQFGVLAQYTAASHHVRRQTTSAELDHHAWQVSGSWMITGEKNSYRGITPLRAFDPAKKGWGAVEIAARYGVLGVDDDAFPLFADPATTTSGYHSWGLGVNWYLTRNVKFMADYDRASFAGGAVNGNRAPERFVSTRFQTSF